MRNKIAQTDAENVELRNYRQYLNIVARRIDIVEFLDLVIAGTESYEYLQAEADRLRKAYSDARASL